MRLTFIIEPGMLTLTSSRCSQKSTMLLAQRTPSVNWEPVPLDHKGEQFAWVWFRPAATPYGLMFAIPPAAFTQPELAVRLTVRQLVYATGLAGEQILCWTLNGMTFDAVGGSSPLLDQVLPGPAADSNLSFTVWMQPLPQQWSGMGSVATEFPGQVWPPATGSGTTSGVDGQLLDAIDSCWSGILQMEAKLGTIRKQLDQSISRLNSLNRDLTSDERRTCDSKDQQEWMDARRWLRDSLSTLSRSVKEIDVGTTSGAGQRHRFDEMYRQHVVPRIPFSGLEQAVHQIEGHRKILQSVAASAQANLSKAGRDAEQRANSVLMRISAKMRSIRRKD
jgi:hypothetical protein